MPGIGALGGIANLVTGPVGGLTVGGADGSFGNLGIGGSSGVGGAGGLGNAGGIGGVGAPATGGEGGSFLDSLGDAFNDLNGQLTATDAGIADFAAGGSSDLHTVMLQMQEASIGLQVGIQVRDRLLEAYQELMRLQV